MSNNFLCTWSVTQKNLISIARERCFLIESLAIPTAVALSQWTGVAGCGCPSSSRVNLIIFPSRQLRKRAQVQLQLPGR